MMNGWDLAEKIVFGLLVMLMCGMLFVAICCPFVESERDAELKKCYLQEPKTDDCRFMLWKYEVGHQASKENANSNALAQGIATGVVISGGMRAATVH